jgi:hypothetical protein
LINDPLAKQNGLLVSFFENGEGDVLYRLPLPRSQANKKTGALKFDDGTTCRCSVMSISTHGVMVSLWHNRELPAEFCLSIDDRTWRVRLVWRAGLHTAFNLLSLQFSPPHPVFETPQLPHKTARFPLKARQAPQKVIHSCQSTY